MDVLRRFVYLEGAFASGALYYKELYSFIGALLLSQFEIGWFSWYLGQEDFDLAIFDDTSQVYLGHIRPSDKDKPPSTLKV